jgi:hypothetical protein
MDEERKTEVRNQGNRIERKGKNTQKGECRRKRQKKEREIKVIGRWAKIARKIRPYRKVVPCV